MTDVAFADLFTFARATTGTRINASGLIESISSGNPRFQYDPITLNKLGLLVEAQLTNLLLYSADASNPTWVKGGIVSATADTATSPDGTSNADTLTALSTGAFRYLRQAPNLTVNTTYTYSVFLKYKGCRWIWLLGQTSIDRFAWFDVQNGIVGTVNSGLTASMEPVGNGWYRAIITFTKTNASGNEEIGIGFADTDGSTSATSGQDVYNFGHQLETGSFATSYIPTTSAQVTRNADSVQITGTDFTDWWNPAAGTYGVTARSSGTSTRPLLSFDDDTTNEQILLRTVGTDLKLTMIAGGVTVADLTIGTIVPDQQFSCAFTFDASGVAATLNGGDPVSDSAITLPTVSHARIGSDKAGNYLGGVIARAVGRPVSVSTRLLRRLPA